MKEKIKALNICTIPNLISLIRLLMIPFIMYAYMKMENIPLAVFLIALSGFSDIIDGKIARKFNMTSEFGKLFDPVADKLTQLAMLWCLVDKYNFIIWLFVLLIIKEIFMIAGNGLILLKTGKMYSAQWAGKLCTAILYASMIILFIFKDLNINIVYFIFILCVVGMIIPFVSYGKFFVKMLKPKKEEKHK